MTTAPAATIKSQLPCLQGTFTISTPCRGHQDGVMNCDQLHARVRHILQRLISFWDEHGDGRLGSIEAATGLAFGESRYRAHVSFQPACSLVDNVDTATTELAQLLLAQALHNLASRLIGEHKAAILEAIHGTAPQDALECAMGMMSTIGLIEQDGTMPHCQADAEPPED